MARKTVSEQDRALAFIKAATREQLDSFIQTATLVRDVRYPQAVVTAPKVVKRKAGSGPLTADQLQANLARTTSAVGYGQQ